MRLNRKGMSYVMTAVLILLFSMLLSLILSYASLMTIIETTREDTQRVLDSFCTQKSISIYQSIKRGSNQMSIGNFTNEYLLNLTKELGLENSGNLLYHGGENGNIVYKIDNPLTANLQNNTLILTTEYTLVIPITFADYDLADVEIPISITSALTLK